MSLNDVYQKLSDMAAEIKRTSGDQDLCIVLR